MRKIIRVERTRKIENGDYDVDACLRKIDAQRHQRD